MVMVSPLTDARRIAAADAEAGDLNDRVVLIEPGKVRDEVVGAFGGARGQGRANGVDAGEHQHGVVSGVVAAEDVGVEPVPDHQRPGGLEGFGRTAEEQRFGLAGHQGLHLVAARDGVDQGAVARGDALGTRDGQVGVGGNPDGTAVDGECRLGKVLPADGRVEALDDALGLVVGGWRRFPCRRS